MAPLNSTYTLQMVIKAGNTTNRISEISRAQIGHRIRDSGLTAQHVETELSLRYNDQKQHTLINFVIRGAVI